MEDPPAAVGAVLILPNAGSSSTSSFLTIVPFVFPPLLLEDLNSLVLGPTGGVGFARLATGADLEVLSAAGAFVVVFFFEATGGLRGAGGAGCHMKQCQSVPHPPQHIFNM
jgi:hypothetical protein